MSVSRTTTSNIARSIPRPSCLGLRYWCWTTTRDWGDKGTRIKVVDSGAGIEPAPMRMASRMLLEIYPGVQTRRANPGAGVNSRVYKRVPAPTSTMDHLKTRVAGCEVAEGATGVRMANRCPTDRRDNWSEPMITVKKSPHACTILVLLTMVLVTMAPSSLASDQRSMEAQLSSAGLEVQETRAFFLKMQSAIANSDKPGLAEMTRFPIEVTIGSEDVRLLSKEQFTHRYNDVVTPALVELVVGTRFDALFANYQGAMLGNGAIWFGPVCDIDGKQQAISDCKDTPIRILRINGVQ
ncbi:MAG: hypothetical protein WBG92_20190 [Thiohalocapsa sp.]